MNTFAFVILQDRLELIQITQVRSSIIGKTRVVLSQRVVAIACKNKMYDIILLVIWGVSGCFEFVICN